MAKMNKPAKLASTSGTADSSNESTAGMISEARLMKGVGERIALMDFLELSYRGGIGYRNGIDANGNPLLIPHETEQGKVSVPVHTGNAKRKASTIVDRYERRVANATYENHVGPIVDSYVAYLMRTVPRRNKTNADEHTRLKLDAHMFETAKTALKLTEAWIGWDEAKLGEEVITRAQAEEADPKRKGQRYIVRRDPRSVVDFEIDDDDRVERVVFREDETEKSSFIEAGTSKTQYREWTATEWVLYEAVREDDKHNLVPCVVSMEVESQKVREIDRGKHSFGRCPWERCKPDFRVEDLADLNRLLFNVASLLDEELYNNTFTLKVVTGMRVEDVVKLVSGPSNVWAFPNPQAEMKTVGAIEGQAASLLTRIQDLRESMYRIAKIGDASEKNVAESGTKKRLDMDDLYACLVKITIEIERVENSLLEGLGLLDPTDDETKSSYSRTFDVEALSSMLEDFERMCKQPYVPAGVKRDLARTAIAKANPYADARDVETDMEDMIDVSPDLVDAITKAKESGLMTADMAALLMGVPEDQLEEFKAAYDKHAVSPFDLTLDENGNPIPGGPQDGSTGSGVGAGDRGPGGDRGNGGAMPPGMAPKIKIAPTFKAKPAKPPFGGR